MNAKVHVLRPSGYRPRNEGLSHPQAEALRQAVIGSLGEALTQLFRSAAKTLQEWQAATGSDPERQACQSLIPVLRMDQAALTRGFLMEINQIFSAAGGRVPNADDLAALPSETLDENRFMAVMTGRARAQHRERLVEVESQLVELGRQLGLPPCVEAVSPEGLGEAFRHALSGLELEFAQRRVALKLFERFVLGALGALLERIGKVLVEVQTPEAAPTREEALDALTLHTLSLVAAQDKPESAVEAALAQDLLDAVQKPAEGRDGAIRQLLALSGQYLNLMLADPYIPHGCKPLLEQLRLPLLKNSLVDRSFFTQNGHPVRAIVNEGVRVALSARLGGPTALTRAKEQLGKLPEGMSISARFVRDSLGDLVALTEPEAAHFLDHARQDAAAQREEFLARVRRTVAHELEVQTLGGDLDVPMQRLLRTGLGTVMSRALLGEGMHSSAWTQACQRVDDVVSSLEPDTSPGTRKALEQALVRDLRAAELQDSRIQTLIRDLRAAWKKADQRPRPAPGGGPELDLHVQRAPTPPPTPAAPTPAPEAAAPESPTAASAPTPAPVTPPAATPAPPPAAAAAPPVVPAPPPAAPAAGPFSEADRQTLLQPESWFRVFDADSGSTQWLKIASVDAAQERIAFAGFSSDSRLRLGVAQFLADLQAGRSEPVNASAAMQQALVRLRAAAPV